MKYKLNSDEVMEACAEYVNKKLKYDSYIYSGTIVADAQKKDIFIEVQLTEANLNSVLTSAVSV